LKALFTSTQWIDYFILFIWTQWIKGVGCSTYKFKPPIVINWICHDGFLFMNVGIKVLFDQYPRDLTSCSHQLIQVIISSTYYLEHNEPHKLTITMNSTWTFISCYSIDVIMLTIVLNLRLCLKFKIFRTLFTWT